MKLEKFAVIGHPIKHTMSPFIHRELFGINGFCPEYITMDVKNISQSIALLKKMDGFNITIPHKQNIIPFLDTTDKKAARFGSVNTVKIENGRMTGYTTDGEGCVLALKCGGVSFEKVLLLGTGGAARAIAFQLEQEGSDITIAGRCEEKAKELAFELSHKSKAKSFECVEKEHQEYDLLINATSVGMYPGVSESPVSLGVINGCQGVFDAVYNPQKTMLIEMSLGLGKKIVYGIDMLVWQAVKAHEIWYGASFPKEKIEKLCLRANQEMSKIFGVGQ